MKLPLQLLDPPAVLPSLHGTGRARLTEAGDRILEIWPGNWCQPTP
jgi:hypothetical protein